MERNSAVLWKCVVSPLNGVTNSAENAQNPTKSTPNTPNTPSMPPNNPNTASIQHLNDGPLIRVLKTPVLGVMGGVGGVF